MTQPALDLSTDPTTPFVERDRGWQLRLFPAQAPEGIEAEIDLRVDDDLAGMYYIG